LVDESVLVSKMIAALLERYKKVIYINHLQDPEECSALNALYRCELEQGIGGLSRNNKEKVCLGLDSEARVWSKENGYDFDKAKNQLIATYRLCHGNGATAE
jgi:hypothetical protein